jgi:DNA-binding CsgD family transcriptional regulator
LSHTESDDLLAAALDGQVDRVTRARLWRITQGNVLFLYELVHAGIQHGQLARRGDVWSWPGEITVGERLPELIEARLAGVTDAERGVLEVLAVGEPLGPAFLGDTGRDLVESLERRGLVWVVQDGARTLIRLGHPLHSEILRSRLGVLRRRSIHNGLADTLAGFGARRRGDLIRLATWRLDGGGGLDAATLMTAARQARAIFDHQLTERCARAAVRCGAGPDAGVLLADSLYWQGRHLEAADLLATLPTGDDRKPESQVWQAIVTASVMFWGLGDAARAEQVLRAAAEALGPGAECDELAAHRASVMLFDGRPVEALAVAERVLADSGATDLTRVRALSAAVPALAVTGQTERAITAAERGVQVVREVADDEPWSLSHLRAGQVSAYWLAGRLVEMEELAHRQYLMATQRHADDDRGMWGLLLGRAMLATGRVATARDQLREAAELLRQNDISGFLSWCLACQAIAATLLGDLTGAGALFEDARRVHGPTRRAHDVELELAEAWLATARGERSLAERLARRAIRTAASRGQRALEAHAVHDAVRLGVPGLHSRLATLASTVDGPMARVFAAHGAALAASDAPGLDRAAQEFAELGAILLAAEASVQAATAYGRTGDTPRQLAATDLGRRLATRCEGARSPALLQAAQSPEIDLLTNREREIAGLAARGCSNRDISTRLVLSVRTVSNHLNHIYGKLGVRREDLPMLLNLQAEPPDTR